MGSILFKAIAGMLAGLAAWAIVEPFKPLPNSEAWGTFELALMFCWAIFLGATVGFMSGYQRGSRTHALKECGLSALFAVIGIMVAKGLAGPATALMTFLPILGRTIAIAIIGAGLGAGIGFSTLVVRRAAQGLIGGLIGGAIAGVLFDTVGTLVSGIDLTVHGVQPGHVGEVGAIPRALTSILMCGAIALMIGIIEALSRSAWIRLELGRNEGKEWALDKPAMLIGRFERADIPLFGDQSVAPQHAVIQKQGNGYVIMDQGTPTGIGVNGQRVQQAMLNPGDVIQIGGFNLRFLMRNSKVPNRGPEPNRGAAYPIGAPTNYPRGMDPVAMQPTMMGQQMPATGMNMGGMQPQMQPTVMNQQPFQPMAPTMTVPAQNFDPTVAVAAQPNFQPTMAVQQSGFALVAMDGPLLGQKFPLGGPIELGRESQQVPMSFDTSASRKHARIEAAGMFVNVTDLGSTNGTFVNGQRVTNATAKNGDIVKVGATNFRIES